MKTSILNYKPTLDSREVAEMIGKEHHKLLRTIKTYIKYLIESNFGVNEFFKESTYKDSIGRQLPNYQITRKGCELIANKMTGKKGVQFTACYINRFHNMEKLLNDIELQRLREESKELQAYKDYFVNIENVFYIIDWKDKTNKTLDYITDLTGYKKNNLLNLFYIVIEKMGVPLESLKSAYLFNNECEHCSMFEVVANSERARRSFDTAVKSFISQKIKGAKLWNLLILKICQLC